MSRNVINTLINAFIFCSGILFGINQVSFAETVEVRREHASDAQNVELPAGSSADVIVMVTSAGEMVNNYNVALVSVEDKRIIAQGVSDANGEVLFQKVSPGKYVAKLLITKDKRRRTTVEIGDLLLRVSK